MKKRLFDIIISASLLILTSPLILLLTILIPLTSKGRPFFKQKRVGKWGKIFTIYKFRTMKENSPKVRNIDGSSYYSLVDERITILGSFLRQWGLDELPQLFNVLKGDMSIVGPRPDEPDQVELYEIKEFRRLLVKPGITGLAQVCGRNSLSWKKRKEKDIEYVKKVSLFFDLDILLKTLGIILRKEKQFTASICDEDKEQKNVVG